MRANSLTAVLTCLKLQPILPSRNSELSVAGSEAGFHRDVLALDTKTNLRYSLELLPSMAYRNLHISVIGNQEAISFPRLINFMGFESIQNQTFAVKKMCIYQFLKIV